MTLRRSSPFVFTLLGAALLLAGCAVEEGEVLPPPKPMRTDFSVRRSVVVSPPGWPQVLEADIYEPEGPGPYPAVLVIFGGGWHAGERNQLAPISQRLASRGYVAVNTSYRLAPQYHFPAQLRDVQLAVVWMRAHAAEYHIDPRRIGALGYSAGAHLAALLGVVNAKDRLGMPGSEVRAVVAGGTPTDLSKPTASHDPYKLIGGTFAEMPEAYREASPVSYVDAGDPPFFLYHGSADRLVPLDHATDFKALLDKAGVPNELMILRGRNHVLGFLTDAPAIDAALQFLDRYLRDAPEAGPPAREPCSCAN